jgi:molybdopterin adenylyltransferase
MAPMPERADAAHRAAAPRSIRCFILTVSDTRTDETDTSGRAIADLLTAAGHGVIGRALVKDEPEHVRNTIRRQLASPDVQAIITTGGTGITSRDSTYEAIAGLIEKRLDGFGELFRMLSYEQIGPAAMMSRACAGLASGRIIVSLPGSEAAVRLAMEKLIIPELGHLVQQASR